jgi:hypothetical protein
LVIIFRKADDSQDIGESDEVKAENKVKKIQFKNDESEKDVQFLFHYYFFQIFKFALKFFVKSFTIRKEFYLHKVDEEKLEKDRRKRYIESLMKCKLREVAVYVAYLAVVYFNAYTTITPNNFKYGNSLRNIFINPKESVTFEEVN